MTCLKDVKSKSLKTLSLMLALALALTLLPVTSAADGPSGIPAFANTSGDGGGDVVSLTAERTFKAAIPVSSAVDTSAVTWALTRDASKPYNDPELYPNQLQGGDMGLWKAGNGQPFFSPVTAALETDNGQQYLTGTFSNICYFYNRGGAPDYSVPHANGGTYLDVCGYFKLTALENGTEIGSVDLKITPYDTFHTMDEIYGELDDMVSFAAQNTSLFVKKYSMGTSTGAIYDGLDMPYIIIADKESSVTQWLEFTEKAETDPAGALADIASGKYNDLRLPVMYSNIHSNETAAVDGIVEFAWTLLKAASAKEDLKYNKLTGFTSDGQAQLAAEMASRGIEVPDLVKNTATYLGWLQTGNGTSGKVDLDKYYTSAAVTVGVSDILEDIFFILVPEENVEGRTYVTRTASNGFDLNRDNSFQVTNETKNMQKLIGTFNPVSFTEFHGRVQAFQCEPCDPPHEPNFEYDLLAEHLMTGGEALGIAAVANNKSYNSYVIPQRDYLFTDGTTATWDAWDDMSTSYTPQFAMLHGTVAYTVELPAYSDDTVDLVIYGIIGQSDYIAAEKLSYLTAQTKIYERGVTNFNSDAYELVGQWFCDQNDVEGAEMALFRPEYTGAGQNGNFYPECYIIPLDAANQKNLQAAYDMMEWLSRNDVKINVSTSAFTYDGVSYPAGTVVVDMHQAKRSVANGALYDGTLIQSWSVLYSEGITAFNKTRGFDMVTVAEPAAYQTISSALGEKLDHDACVSYIAGKSSVLTGTGEHVIISNVSEASASAVNELLKSGKKVGMVTDSSSAYYGDFVCLAADWQSVASKYMLTGTGVSSAGLPEAKLITKSPKVYITGGAAPNTSGFVWTTRVASVYNWNYDRLAMEYMGFDTVSEPASADAVIGASRLSGDALEAVKDGTPYIGYGSTGASAGDIFGSALARTAVPRAMDCLGYVTYPETTLVNASYVMDNDDILYGYGAGYFSAIPEGAKVLVKMDGSKMPLEGFLPTLTDAQQTAFDAYIGGSSVQGISYEGKDASGNDVNVVLFANSLTHKAHQRDEYGFISNFLFSSCLGDEAYYTAPVTPQPGGEGSGSGQSGPSIVKPEGGSVPAQPSTPVQPASPAAEKFDDVNNDSWFLEAVDYALEKGLMNGTGEKTFEPNVKLSRAMLATILYRLEGSPAPDGENIFTDVSESTWYTDAIIWAAANGVVNGYGDGKFGPMDDVTREQAAAMLMRYAAFKGLDTSKQADLSAYDDAGDISGWALESVQWANAEGLILGRTPTTVVPKGTTTRAEAATMLMRFCENVVK